MASTVARSQAVPVVEPEQENVSSVTAELNGTEENNQENIARLAYTLWQERGCPSGSSDEDWIEAERLLANPKVRTASAGR